VRQEAPYTLPAFAKHPNAPLIYLSFGSLGAGDVTLLKRLIAAMGRLPYRALVNVGAHKDKYSDVPANVIIESWFPQPSLIPQVDVVIHHGGNNSFTECLYFGKPALIMPFAWDGHDNATRVQETGYGYKLNRADWSEAELDSRLAACLNDSVMRARLAVTSKHMREQDGPAKAAQLLGNLLQARTPRMT
jgi:UDP:flavonoid glycosyltransferase YjiC (YdhE family)